MKNIIIFVCLAFCAIFHFSCANSPKNAKADRYVVVLSLDGFRSDYPEMAHTPTLDSLARVGVRADFRPCFPSVTFSNHYAMATGLHPDHHGLINNYFYAEDLDKIYTIGNREAVSNPDFYGGEPIWNTAERQGVKAANFYWVGSETPVNGRQPSIWKPFASSVSFRNRADSVLAWLRLPLEERPRLLMWYIEEPDAIGHSATPDSSATIRMVEELDQLLNYFFTEARQLDIFDRIDFMVLSDHGMGTYYPENYVNLNDYLPRDSFDYVFDGVPTLLYTKESYRETAYEILQHVPNIEVYKKEEIPAKYHYGTHPRISNLVVIPKIGTYVQFRANSSPRLGGAHGYDNYVPTMQAIFYAAGPSFKSGERLPAIANVNLYLLICKLLDLQPAPNDGTEEEVAGLLK
ncbi:putative AlkP superfamily pyrophosphatase or phosphodiesterase [Parabacteroides sp. PFB2-12]|uniref:alkaline phosphatase family protein n=1 Tax=unclassified Parabacteroides TaxID=2649774 RepID=UPI0024771CA6|nr:MULTISPECIES: ectonucleotide pyrophosphatase/phosphodiesterase [unclassified Parabacteroides]MDH6344141.1 putative AlkP superfamily pyrophosphatase or phosphodiesterase [Parabacteroides sp. PM6-13]MDH6392034.1 putative AlkP superfamily pyrophosphatase or phosphodiesterase [Parabacteroides sp. PFB2-12]